jgi:sigma-54 specific flagellar transcriptional regulator A
LPTPIGERRRSAHSAPLVTIPPTGLDLREHLGNIEKQLIRSALEQTDGTVAHAARLLKLQRTTLVEKLRKYELSAHAADAVA